MLFSWEHLKYQNSHPGAHFGTGLGEPWGGCSEPEISFRAMTIYTLYTICNRTENNALIDSDDTTHNVRTFNDMRNVALIECKVH